MFVLSLKKLLFANGSRYF